MFLEKKSSFTILLFFVFGVSSSLMISLAMVNDGAANDDHIEVVEFIFNEGKTPEPQRCWQCYHPKFYHGTIAKLSQVFNLETKATRTILAQLINAIAGIFTLLICWIFIKRQPFPNHVKLLTFTMIALNPRFIAIHAQASNDAFLILFGTIILFSLYTLMDKFDLKYFFVLLIVSILAGITKGNGFILIIGIVIVFFIKIMINLKVKWKSYAVSLLFFIITTTLLVGYFGEYFDNYKKHGKPVVYNTPITDMPSLFEKTTFRRPGIRSIVEGYFTFRIIDMIQNPRITNEYNNEFPLHRTSLWSQLYGRSNFIYFDNWPAGKWQSSNPTMMNIGRVSLSLGIIPLILFLIGYLKDLKRWIGLVFRKKWKFINDNQEWIFHIFVFGFIAFILLFTATGRDYSFMKIIYLYPCILAILIPLLKGFEYGFKFFSKERWRVLGFYFLMIVLFISYLIPILNLISNLKTV